MQLPNLGALYFSDNACCQDEWKVDWIHVGHLTPTNLFGIQDQAALTLTHPGISETKASSCGRQYTTCDSRYFGSGPF